MGFLQKLWKDRISQFPKRYALKQQANGITQQVELELQDGVVQEGGDTFNAATMNDLEQRIADAIDECGSGEDVSDLKDRTKTGSTDFYFDQKDGKYGWNSSKQRGADTFHPFNTIHTLIKTITSKTTTDLGEYHEYRTIDTTNVVNTNSGTYTFPANDTGGTKDLGATNTYRFVNAGNVYNKGKADQKFQVWFPEVSNTGTGSGNGASQNNIIFDFPTGKMKTLSVAAYHCSGDYAKNQDSYINKWVGTGWQRLWTNPKTYNDVAGGTWDISDAAGIQIVIGSYGQEQWAKFTDLYFTMS